MTTIDKIIKFNGNTSKINITSADNHQVNLPNNYKLANNLSNSKFRKSLLGYDIGINSEGFGTIAIISSLIAVSTFIILFLSFRI